MIISMFSGTEMLITLVEIGNLFRRAHASM